MVGVATAPCRARRPALNVQDISRVAAGKPRVTATTRRVASIGAETFEADASGPNLLGLAAPSLGRVLRSGYEHDFFRLRRADHFHKFTRRRALLQVL